MHRVGIVMDGGSFGGTDEFKQRYPESLWWTEERGLHIMLNRGSSKPEMDFTGPAWSADCGELRRVVAADITEEASARNAGSEPQLALSGSPPFVAITPLIMMSILTVILVAMKNLLTSKAFLLCFWTVDSIGLKS